MKVYVLGCGGTLPLPQRHLTSVMIQRDGEEYLFDCGEATQISLKRLHLRWKKLSHIFISHTHADHVTGLPGILMLSSQVNREEPMHIYGPVNTKEFVQAMIKTLHIYLNYEIVIHEFDHNFPQTVLETDELRVYSYPAVHSRPCVGYVLEEKDKPGRFFPEKAKSLGLRPGPSYQKLQSGQSVTLPSGQVITPEDVMGPPRPGYKIAYLTDSTPAASVVQSVFGADLFICEGMFLEELRESALEKGHMTAFQAAQMAKEAKVGRLGLIHYSPRYMSQDIEGLLREAIPVFPETFLTKDRMEIDLPPKG